MPLDDYYNRFDPARRYTELLFRADRTLQSAELNEAQQAIGHRIRSIGDVLFKDGDVVRDGRIVVDPGTGAVECESGAVYLVGAVLGVPPGSLVVPTTGVIAVGVYRREVVVTEIDDPSLYNPADGTRAEGEPGAARLRVDTSWGWQGNGVTDGQQGDFYPVYTVENGELRAKEAPPNLDAITQAIGKYDVDSAGGTYVVSGLTVRMAADAPDGAQMYTVSEGRARITGLAVELMTSRRLRYEAVPDLIAVDSEPHAAIARPGDAPQRIELDRTPVAEIQNIRITRQSAATLTHGSYSTAADPLPDTAVLEIISVTQDEITFTQGQDYKLTAGKIDWSLPGIKPATGSSYHVVYRHIVAVAPVERDDTGVSVAEAVPGTLIQVSYTAKLPRIDRLAITADGEFTWLQGIPADYMPLPPVVPGGMLALAKINQTWTAARSVTADGTHMVPMTDISSLFTRLNNLTEQVALQRLESDIHLREAGSKKGIFVDPFLNDEMRDQGIDQTAAIVNGELTLPVSDVSVARVSLGAPRSLPYATRVALEQPMRTGSMPINPYQAFDPLPKPLTLTPSVDSWTDIQTNWTSPITQAFNRTRDGYYHVLVGQETSSSNQVVSSSTTRLEYLRRIDVAYELRDFGPGERITEFTFDGVAVIPSNTTADAAGVIRGTFTIPPDIPAGAKQVQITGSGGSKSSGVFIGQGNLTTQTVRQVNTVINWYVDPLGQTMTPTRAIAAAGFRLWFTAKGGSDVIVQLRETQIGYPIQSVLAEQRISPDDIHVDGRSTEILFPAPCVLAPNTEVALVVLCDDAVSALAIAEIGKWDQHYGQWVTSQPYQIGVLVSSSNGSTWTSHQDKDLAFQLLEAVYDPVPVELSLGTAGVDNATDIMLLSLSDVPSAAARIEYRLNLPSGENLSVAENQPVRLARPLSGDIAVSARLTGTREASPVLYPGTQLVCGSLRVDADYVTRAVPAGADGTEYLTRIIINAFLPAGSGVTARIGGENAREWIDAPVVSSRPVDDGFQEIVCEARSTETSVRVRLTLSGSSSARPRIRDLRMMLL